MDDFFKPPRLKTVNKVCPEYPLGKFPSTFINKFCENITYIHLTYKYPDMSGNDWEQIFSDSINADWKPSNIGLDDIVLNQSAWGAKTVQSTSNNIFNTSSIRLISGRNSPIYSYDAKNISKTADPLKLGREVLGIWNERVSSIRQKYKFVRTCVLIRNKSLTNFIIFEKDTIRYDPNDYNWIWNSRGNLTGIDKNTNKLKFTWQPHGSQFTISEDVPTDALKIKIIKTPNLIDKNSALKNIQFDSNWYTVIN